MAFHTHVFERMFGWIETGPTSMGLVYCLDCRGFLSAEPGLDQAALEAAHRCAADYTCSCRAKSAACITPDKDGLCCRPTGGPSPVCDRCFQQVRGLFGGKRDPGVVGAWMEMRSRLDHAVVPSHPLGRARPTGQDLPMGNLMVWTARKGNLDGGTDDPLTLDLTRPAWSLTGMLDRWIGLWARAQRTPVKRSDLLDDGTPMVLAQANWLRLRLRWASENPDASQWALFAEGLRATSDKMHAELGWIDAPGRPDRPCPDCGQYRLERPNGQTRTVCKGCGTVFPDERALVAADRTAMPLAAENAPDQWLPFRPDKRLVGLNQVFPGLLKDTLKKWAKRGHVAARRKKGRTVYRVGDIAARLKKQEQQSEESEQEQQSEESEGQP
ncbi:MAG: TFIIB-type zinc ribbon-containing protein [Propionibacteriaceae bacterium]|nr:TFIIB-type zinc ribbon-containing protein [Propionibacteriaceae bacterium]